MKLVLGVFDAEPHQFHNRWIDETWMLSDINPRHSNIVEIDARSIPFHDLEAIYASHVVEHIAGEEILPMLQNWFTALAPGGRIIINVPDMAWVEMNLQDMDKKRLEEIVFGGRDTPYDLHRSWFTKGYLEDLLKTSGFQDVVVTQEVEAHNMGCLIAEAHT